MKDDVLEIRITKISKEYSAVDIIKFNSEIEYDEEDIVLREYENFSQYKVEEKVLYINKTYVKQPFAIKNELISSLREKVDEINEKYGVERFPIKRVDGGVTFYYLNELLNVECTFESTPYSKINEDEIYKIYNYFDEEEEAEWCSPKMKAYLLELRKEWREKNERN